MRIVIIIAASLLVASPALANDCTALNVKSSRATRAADAVLIRKGARQVVWSSKVSRVITDGKWRLIWAVPENTENGVFFFRRVGKSGLRYVSAWGGVIDEGGEQAAINWAGKLVGGGPSPRVTKCFAHILTS
jgi:hypothetical protein